MVSCKTESVVDVFVHMSSAAPAYNVIYGRKCGSFPTAGDLQPTGDYYDGQRRRARQVERVVHVFVIGVHERPAWRRRRRGRVAATRVITRLGCCSPSYNPIARLGYNTQNPL